MKKKLYLFAVLLFIVWLILAIAYSQGGLIHLLLVMSVVAIAIGLTQKPHLD